MGIVRDTKTGKIIVQRFSIKQLEQAAEDSNGFCRACGSKAYGIEPDARRCVCESCGMPQVYGAEEIALMGWVK